MSRAARTRVTSSSTRRCSTPAKNSLARRVKSSGRVCPQERSDALRRIPSTEHRAMAGIERVSYRIVVTFTLPGVEPPVSGCLRATKLHRHRRCAGGRYFPLLRGLGGDPDRLLQRLDAFPHQPLGLLLTARPCRLNDKLLGGGEALHQGGRHVLARAERLREGHLDGACARARPHTGRSRRIKQRPLIHAHSALPVIVRYAHRHGPRAAPAPTIVGREADVVDPAVITGSFPLST